MASKEWSTIPWLGDNPPKDILHRLLDIAVDIPEYLSWFDNFSSMLETATSSSSSELTSLQTTVWEKAMELNVRLKLWEGMYVMSYPGGGPWDEINTIPSSDFPVFKCRDPNTLKTYAPRDLVYPDLLLATFMCFYWAMRLIISSTDGGLPSVLTIQERYESACNICRSMKYYVQNIPGSLVSRMMFVLQIAHESLADGTIEREFVMNLFLYIGKKFGFPAFSNQCSSPHVAIEGG